MTHFDLEINFKIPKKRHSMASLINLLSNGVNGFDGFYGVKGVFDNLPKNSYVWILDTLEQFLGFII